MPPKKSDKAPSQADKEATQRTVMEECFGPPMSDDSDGEPEATSTPEPKTTKGKGKGKKSAPLSQPVNTPQETEGRSESASKRARTSLAAESDPANQAWLKEHDAQIIRNHEKKKAEQAKKEQRQREALAAALQQQEVLRQQRLQAAEQKRRQAEAEIAELNHQPVVGGVVVDDQVAGPSGLQQTRQQSSAAVNNEADESAPLSSEERRRKNWEIRSLEAELDRTRAELARRTDNGQFYDAESEDEEHQLTIDEREVEDGEIVDPTHFNFSKGSASVDMSKRSWTTWTARELKEDARRLRAQLDRILQGRGDDRVLGEIAITAQDIMHRTISMMNNLNESLAGGTQPNQPMFREAMQAANGVVESK
jgi:hypothetical protein